jgi:hypothetical protein
LPSPFTGAMAVPLCPPRRTALPDWDIAEKDESVSEGSSRSHPEKISVSVQVGDERVSGDNIADSSPIHSDRRSQLTKQVLSPVDIDSRSPDSSHSVSASSETSHSSTSTERERRKVLLDRKVAFLLPYRSCEHCRKHRAWRLLQKEDNFQTI